MIKTKVGIINVTGYAGVELARLLCKHPMVTLVSVTGRSAAGQKLSRVFPHLSNIDLDITAELGEVELAFSAMPHRESTKEIIPLLAKGVKVVDISSDFRLKDPAAYPAWYNFTHPKPELLQTAVFGLTELHRTEVANASLVANPGCYPTGAILAFAPVVKASLIKPEIIADSKSGVSGAGRTLSLTTHYAETNEDVSAYALEGHRHLPEIVQELGLLNPAMPPLVTFVPHLIPMTRGILTTGYAALVPGKLADGKKGGEELIEFYRSYYNNEPFVKIVDFPPHTKYVSGSNFCLIYPKIDQRTGRLIVVSVIDNLVKGAAGQAIQNMNVMLGFPETTGIDTPALYP
jgi:N-acetyl-gamma-glutamyl-phosphate reductase